MMFWRRGKAIWSPKEQDLTTASARSSASVDEHRHKCIRTQVVATHIHANQPAVAFQAGSRAHQHRLKTANVAAKKKKSPEENEKGGRWRRRLSERTTFQNVHRSKILQFVLNVWRLKKSPLDRMERALTKLNLKCKSRKIN